MATTDGICESGGQNVVEYSGAITVTAGASDVVVSLGWRPHLVIVQLQSGSELLVQTDGPNETMQLTDHDTAANITSSPAIASGITISNTGFTIAAALLADSDVLAFVAVRGRQTPIANISNAT